jgi:hypothetical protein
MRYAEFMHLVAWLLPTLPRQERNPNQAVPETETVMGIATETMATNLETTVKSAPTAIEQETTSQNAIRRRKMMKRRTNQQNCLAAIFICLWDSKLSIITLYIDNFTMACNDLQVILCNKEVLKRHYNMTDLREISYILSMHITWDYKAG